MCVYRLQQAVMSEILRLPAISNEPSNSCEDQIFKLFTKDILLVTFVLPDGIELAAVYTSGIHLPPAG